MRSMLGVASQALKDAGQGALVEKLSRSLGHGMGIEFRESGSSLSTKAEGASK